MTVGVERNSEESWLPPWVIREHQARYQFASTFVLGKEVVDCACGSGESSYIFSKAGAERVIGIDADLETLNSAILTYRGTCLSFATGSGTDIPLNDASADVFICLESIEHVDADSTFVTEIARVLRPGGMLILSTPNRNVTNPGSSLDRAPWNKYHVREYDEQELDLLTCSEFEIVEKFGQNPVPAIFLGFSKLLSRIFGTLFAVRFNQLYKCRWFLIDGSKLHTVQKSKRQMEYFVWVLRRCG
jgi:ubiquinone/menaquinone biosynthesis C-methylase UbiE